MKSDDIMKEFERDVPLPDSLSKSNMVKMLNEKAVTPEKKKIKIFPKVISAAAVFVIVTVVALSIGFRSEFVDVSPTSQAITTEAPSKAEPPQKTDKATTSKADNEQKSAESSVSNLRIAKSEKDLRNHFLKMYTENKIDDYVDTLFSFGAATEDAVILYDNAIGSQEVKAESNMSPTMAPQAQANSTVRGDAPHGTTNVQVADVDEGDIIKNDGEYLYIVSRVSSGPKIIIVNAKDMKTVYSKSIYADKKDKCMNILDIYVNGNILTAVCTYDSKTYSVVYDITRKFAPEEIRRVDQDGHYVSSRMVDEVLYTVTNYTVRGSSAKEIEENAIPQVNCDCIDINKCYILDEDSTSYVILSAFDTKEKNGDVSTVSLLGNGYEVYSSAKNLYVYSEVYDDRYDGTFTTTTNIYSFSIDGTDIRHKATGSVKGYCINQYSFDEYNGNLRIATCYYDYKTNKDISCVYVLNDKLEKIGEVFNLADDEQVKAVRFMGGTGYVVTFRNTDPLFIIDFSDPTKPAVTGELKIPGYSTYIHPIGDGYLVGIGYDGNDENADFDKVKVSLFDVRDKTNPKETDTFIVKNAYSMVNDNPKAFFYYPEKNMVGLPVTHFGEKGNSTKGIQTLIIEDGKIVSNLGFVHINADETMYYGTYADSSSDSRVYADICYAYEPLFRGTYIGDLLYTIDNSQVIEHNINTAERTRVCFLSSKEDENKKSTVNAEDVSDNTIAYVQATTTPPQKQ